LESYVVSAVQSLKPYLLEVTFADGERRIVGVEPELFGPVFEPLRDPAFFNRVCVDAELGTVVCPNSADLAPEFRRAGRPIPAA